MTHCFEDLNNLQEYIENSKYEVNEYIFDRIKEYILSSEIEPTISLFQYKRDSMIYKIEISSEIEKLENPLLSCLEKFEEIEEYEKCSECVHLLSVIKQ